jgi:hypothetical protein
MAVYTTAKILLDGDSKPIPQYLDTSDTTDSPEGTFKPLTQTRDTQLTGSIVQVATALQVTILAGSSSIVLTAPDVVVSDFKKIIVGFNADASHPVRTTLHWQPTGGATYLLEEILSVTASRTLTNHIEAKGIRCAVQVFNDDTVDHTYDVVVLGVR